MSEPLEAGTLEPVEVHPGTINYFDQDGNFVIAPDIPRYRAEKRAWEARLQEALADEP